MKKTVTFGKKTSMNEKFETVQKRLGATTGASKGSKPAPKAKVTPKVSAKGGGTVGFTVKKKF